MAIEDDVFVNVLGETVSREGIVQEMIDLHAKKFKEGLSKITDFNEGSEIRNLLEDFAVAIFHLREDEQESAKIIFVETAYGEWLDKHGANPDVQLPRETGDVSTGVVTFSIPETAVSSITIGEGSVLSSSVNDLEYEILSDTVIGVGEDSARVRVECLTVGEDGNLDAGELDTIVSDLGIPGLTVSNESAITGGSDYEEDEDYRERLLAFRRRDGFGSLPYYQSLAEAVSGVHDVLFVDETGYTMKVLVNGDSKPCSDEILFDVLALFTDVNNVVLNQSFIADKVTTVPVDLVFNVTVPTLLDEDDITALFQDFFDGGSSVYPGIECDGFSIGESLTKEALYSVLGVVDDFSSFTVLYDGSELTEVSVDEDKVLMLGDLTINQTEE